MPDETLPSHDDMGNLATELFYRARDTRKGSKQKPFSSPERDALVADARYDLSLSAIADAHSGAINSIRTLPFQLKELEEGVARGKFTSLAAWLDQNLGPLNPCIENVDGGGLHVTILNGYPDNKPLSAPLIAAKHDLHQLVTVIGEAYPEARPVMEELRPSHVGAQDGTRTYTLPPQAAALLQGLFSANEQERHKTQDALKTKAAARLDEVREGAGKFVSALEHSEAAVGLVR